MIDRYLADVASRLPLGARGRFLREAEAHLREAARELGSEEEAVQRFGEPADVARRVAAELVPWARRRAAFGLLALLVAFVVPYYGIPENTLPPAPWESKPDYLLALQAATGTLFFLAAAAALLRELRVALSALVASVAVALGTGVAWALEVDGAWGTLVYAGLVALLLLGLAGGAGAWARSYDVAASIGSCPSRLPSSTSRT